MGKQAKWFATSSSACISRHKKLLVLPDRAAKAEEAEQVMGWAWSHLCEVQGKGKESACCIPLLLPNLHVVTVA